MFVLSGKQVWDCFKKLMPYQASTAIKYQKDPTERNKIKVHMKDGTFAFFTMKDDKSYIYEKKF